MTTEANTPTPTPTPSSVAETIYGGNQPAAPAPAANPAPAAAAEPAANPNPAPAASADPATPPAGDPPAGDPAKPEGDPAPTPTTHTAADYTFEFPDNFKADEALVGKFGELAAKANLDPAVAKDIMGLYVEAAQAQATALQTEWTNITTGWRNEVMAFPEFAQDKREHTTTLIGRVMDEFSTPEDRATFDQTGLGNHPAFVRLVLNLTNALMEGEATPPGGPTKNPGGKTNRPQSLGQAIYGDN